MQTAPRGAGAHRRKDKLLGSFSLLVAAAMFTIPYERLKARHPLARQDLEPPDGRPGWKVCRRTSGFCSGPKLHEMMLSHLANTMI